MINLETFNFRIANHYNFNAFRRFFLLLSITIMTACGGNTTIKPEPKIPTTSSQTPVTTPSPKSGSGGYYLDDGPGDNAPADIDSIPDAVLKTEVPQERANKPYVALGQQYTPMTTYTPYKKQGIASWYGKRYHGKKTSTGEIYDMYAMSGAHTILPIPSYAKVTNPANGRTVIVRINDRGPFKHDRLIDLSYAAAYKLRLIGQGSGLVEVETIDTSTEAMLKNASKTSNSVINPSVANDPTTNSPLPTTSSATMPTGEIPVNNIVNNSKIEYFVQAGAFKSEANSVVLQKKIQGLQLAENVDVANVYNNGLYRVKLGPYTNKKDADASADNIRRQLNIAAIVQNQ